MVGGSYGGGIQIVTAAIDCRVDAIVPIIAWHSLDDEPLQGRHAEERLGVDPHRGDERPVGRSAHPARATRRASPPACIDQDDRDWFAQRGPGDLVARIKIPTLIVQGTVDTLFTLDEGIENYRILRDHDVPTAMMWFCGGHGVCLTDPGDPTRVQTALINWLGRYVKRDTTIDTGARFDFVDQNGTRYTDRRLPGRGRHARHRRRKAAPCASFPTADPVPRNRPPAAPTPLAGIAAGITPAPATNAVNVKIDFDAPAVVVGAPQLQLSYHGTTPAGVKPTRVFAQLVDPTTGVVVGNQITPIKVTLDGKPHTVSVPLEVIAFTARAGSRLTLQLVATTTAYAQPRLGGTIEFTGIDVSLPTAADLLPK